MTFLADENFPRLAIQALREAGYEVQWIGDSSRGMRDEDVLASSISLRSVLLTLDKDFGELVHKQGIAAECGVVLFRVEVKSPDAFSALAVRVLSSRQDWEGHFTVVSQGRVRMIPVGSVKKTQP